MKVLVCIPCLLTGGTEIQTLNLVQALVDGGHEVTTVCYFEFSENMIKRYESAGSRVICLNQDGSRPVGTFNTVKFLYSGFKNVIKNVKPDIAHVQYMAPGAIPVILLKLLGVKKIIATAHTFADIYPSLRLLRFLQRHVLTAFTCITELAEKSFFGTSQLYSSKTELKKKGNHFTIYNSLPKHFQISEEKKNYSGPITIGVVSRLEKIKGMDLVVPAFVKVNELFPDTRFIVVGDGSLLEMMKEQAKDLDCGDSIEWCGRQPQEALSGWYKKMDIVLMPSRSEGFGLTAIEAMAYGCVVVASHTGGLPEVVSDGEVGLLHSPESVEDMAEKIVNLLEDHGKFSRLTVNAQQYVTRFSFERYSKEFNNLYKRIVE